MFPILNPPPSPYHPSGSSQCTSPKHPVPITFLIQVAMAPHSSTLAWKIPWMEETGGLQSMGSLRVGHDWATSLSLSCIGEGNGNPLQYSCLENPRGRGAWWADIYGVTQSRTRLKWRCSSSSTKSAFWISYHYFWPSLVLFVHSHFFANVIVQM